MSRAGYCHGNVECRADTVYLDRAGRGMRGAGLWEVQSGLTAVSLARGTPPAPPRSPRAMCQITPYSSAAIRLENRDDAERHTQSLLACIQRLCLHSGRLAMRSGQPRSSTSKPMPLSPLPSQQIPWASCFPYPSNCRKGTDRKCLKLEIDQIGTALNLCFKK